MTNNSASKTLVTLGLILAIATVAAAYLTAMPAALPRSVSNGTDMDLTVVFESTGPRHEFIKVPIKAVSSSSFKIRSGEYVIHEYKTNSQNMQESIAEFRHEIADSTYEILRITP